jgi:hypothetical protein
MWATIMRSEAFTKWSEKHEYGYGGRVVCLDALNTHYPIICASSDEKLIG